MPDLSEAEIQYFIVLIELAQPKETPNNNFYRFHPESVEEAATYFKGFRVDWSGAIPSLLAQGLIARDGDGYTLTEHGARVANQARDDRPPIWYWYKQYYSTAPHSAAFATFCERLYGRHLCQTNFSDMAQLDKLIEVLRLRPGDTVLDIGCGVGMIAEYVSDCTGARVTGIDYAPAAIEQALRRTEAKRERLAFRVANMDALDFPAGSFDAIMSIDTLYMPNDLDATLRALRAMLTPGGRMGIFYTHMLWDPREPREDLLAPHTPLARALTRVGLPFESWDYSEATHHHLQVKRRVGEALRPAFEAEGNTVLYDYVIAESESSAAPYDPRTCNMSRTLYRVLAGP